MDGVTNYKEHYKECLNTGQEFQDFIAITLLKEMGIVLSFLSSKKFQYDLGENLQGIEIKFDDKFKNTGNIYIEIKEKSHPDNTNYVNSGIYRKDNTWLYLIGDYSCIYIFGKEHLKLMHNSKKYKEVTTTTSIGFLIPSFDANKYCLKKIKIK